MSALQQFACNIDASFKPAAPEYWCFDPVQKRRGVVFGEIAQPIYFSLPGAGDGPDVDSVPLPAWASTRAQPSGEIRFNTPGDLQNCPQQPTATPDEVEYQDGLEEAEYAREN